MYECSSSVKEQSESVSEQSLEKSSNKSVSIMLDEMEILSEESCKWEDRELIKESKKDWIDSALLWDEDDLIIWIFCRELIRIVSIVSIDIFVGDKRIKQRYLNSNKK